MANGDGMELESAEFGEFGEEDTIRRSAGSWAKHIIIIPLLATPYPEAILDKLSYMGAI